MAQKRYQSNLDRHIPASCDRVLSFVLPIALAWSQAQSSPALAIEEKQGSNEVAEQVAFGSQSTKPDFQPMQYIGRWYEVSSLKQGFAGEGQEDCHCTQGVYTPKQYSNARGDIEVQVSTFCIHGSPSGRVSGIQGAVTCTNPEVLRLLPEFESDFERREGIVEKCALKFPAIPFIPAEPYNVIRTDYTTYALVQGSKDTSFVQIYSRTPNPGQAFIDDKKAMLQQLGYDVSKFRDTPQDCSDIPIDTFMKKMDDMMESMDKQDMDGMKDDMEASGAMEIPKIAALPVNLGNISKGGAQFLGIPMDPIKIFKDIIKLFGGSFD